MSIIAVDFVCFSKTSTLFDVEKVALKMLDTYSLMTISFDFLRQGIFNGGTYMIDVLMSHYHGGEA